MCNNIEIMEHVYEHFKQYCLESNYDKIRQYLITYPELSNYDNGYFFELIADTGNLKLLKLFVDNGAKVNIDDNYILYTCVKHKYLNCLKYLILDCKADLSFVKSTMGNNNYNWINEQIHSIECI